MIFFALILNISDIGVRRVEATACKVVDVRLSVGMSTLLEFDQEPTLTFHADDQHFSLKNSESAKRSLAIIPNIREQDVRSLFPNTDFPPGGAILADALDRTYRTNLFVFFKGSGRLMFQLRFVDKSKADYVLKIKQVFRKDCLR